MCIIAAGTSAQPLVATLFQLAFLLVVLKLAPYDGDTDDQASFIAALTLTLTMLCGFALMMDNPLEPNFDPSITGGVMMFISIGCLVLEFGVMAKEKCKTVPGAALLSKMKSKHNKKSSTKVSPGGGGDGMKNKKKNQEFQNWGSSSIIEDDDNGLNEFDFGKEEAADEISFLIDLTKSLDMAITEPKESNHSHYPAGTFQFQYIHVESHS